MKNILHVELYVMAAIVENYIIMIIQNYLDVIQNVGDTFDIFELIVKIQTMAGYNFALPQALQYIINYFNLSIETKNFSQDEERLADWQIFNRYDKISNLQNNEKRIVEMKIYDDTILNYLPHPRIIPWEEEGISKEVIQYHNICYNSSSQAIVIPHYNIDNQLIGIRERTLIKENEIYGKYRPMYLNHQMYNHPLGFNLYNLNWSKDNIKNTKKVIIFESEKSCLKFASYFGKENDISVAVCGSSISNFQFQLLRNLEIEEMVIAFDRQYQKIGDEEYKGWTKKLLDLSKKFNNYCKVSFIFDTENKLNYKDAPIDLTPEIFIYLYKKRLNEKGQ